MLRCCCNVMEQYTGEEGGGVEQWGNGGPAEQLVVEQWSRSRGAARTAVVEGEVLCYFDCAECGAVCAVRCQVVLSSCAE
jgi:hypothetical protein